ncbi:hypothetical protein AB0383_20485 [Amycolatopsis sp. NPDC051373]|uniref:hypothetical protein n=1 Tax=Amycolatopsis sp. NPDC051373 TaxID=3155801 RepID=UPI00344BD8D2
MGKKAEQIFDELFDGYQALGNVILEEDNPSARLLAYLDGYCDAMTHASEVLERDRPKLKRLFPLLKVKRIRSAVLKAMAEQRAWREGEDRG